MKKVVIKLGTSSLTEGTKVLSLPNMLEMTKQIVSISQRGHQVVMVSSGAVAAGREVLNHPKMNRLLPFKQMLASVGQVHLMHTWKNLFAIYGYSVGQVLLTRSDFKQRHRFLNVRDTFNCLFEHRVIPIVNENDTVATDEVKVGDNDNLSAHVANLIGADLLILLTDQKGLYTSDPRANPDASLIPIVDKIDSSIFALAGGADESTGLGTGGMITKIEAARLATQGGTPTVIASSGHSNAIVEIMEGKAVGTFFKAATTPRESRKRWLLSEKPQGFLILDDGACEKVIYKGASLLAVGVTHASENFERSAILELKNRNHQVIALGMTNYSSQEIQKIMGLKSTQIEENLPFNYGDEVIHRDNMAVLR